MKRLIAWSFAVAALLIVQGDALAASRVSEGSTVKLVYSLTADGATVVSEAKKEGMIVVVGQGAYPPEFEKRLIGLKKGEKKQIVLKPEQAFGPYRKELLYKAPKAKFPANLQLKEGQLLGGKNGQRPVRVAKILPDSVVLDGNSLLAGKTLVYKVEVQEVR